MTMRLLFWAIVLLVSPPAQAGVSLNGPDSVCAEYVRHSKQEPQLHSPADFTQDLLMRNRSAIPSGAFSRLLSVARDPQASGSTVLAFIGPAQIARAASLVHQERLEADDFNHRHGQGTFQNIVFFSSLAGGLLVWAVLKMNGLDLDPYVSQGFQVGGIGLASIYASLEIPKRVFGPSYLSFLRTVVKKLFSTPLKPIYWGNEFSGTDRLSRHKLDILFTQSEVPAMAERDIFEDLPAETPVMLVFIQPK